jgi:ketopantoate reductase
MSQHVSPAGVVGLGALGSAVVQILGSKPQESPGAVLFCTKAFDLEQALIEQAQAWAPALPFVILSNGYVWPIIEKLNRLLSKRPVRIGMTTIGSTISKDGQVQVFLENSQTAWGNWANIGPQPSAQELETLGRFPNSSWHHDIRPLIRQKWILNVVINSLAAVYRLPNNGSIVQHKAEADRLLEESWDLAQQIFMGVPPDITITDMQAKLWQVIGTTANNENSMARDVRLKRRTESDYLAGMATRYPGYPTLRRMHELLNDF